MPGDLTGRTLGEFVLAARIGEGGHGTVYRAHQPALGRDVVVKVLRTQRQHSPVAQERFLREAQLASLLHHPYAAHIYAFGIDEPDSLMWIAMELVHGSTLQDWLSTHGPMSLDRLVPFMEHVAQVVHAAHEHGIVHRDLKPSNMMVIEQGGSLFPKLLDFGIAKAPSDIPTPLLRRVSSENTPAREAITRSGDGPAGHSTVTSTDPDDSGPPGPLTLPGSGIGSPAYMSPEQWRDAWTVGPAADIYALGVIAYRALAGVEPFVSADTRDYYRQHQEDSPPELGGKLASVDHVLARALAKEPGARYATALELAAELRAALRGSEREQLRAAAQQWEDLRRSPGRLWGREELPQLERWARNAPDQLSPLEVAFVAASQRRVRRGRGLRWGALAMTLVVAALLYRSTVEGKLVARQAEFQTQLAATAVTQAELEQGRAALLHGEPDAAVHLQRAYLRDPRPSTAFMLARALQPRLALHTVIPSSAGRMWSASFSRDGSKILTSDDKNAQLWSADGSELLATMPHDGPVYRAVFFAGDTRILTASDDGHVRIWDATTAQLVRTLQPPGRAPHYYAAVASANGALVAAIDILGEKADLWDAETGSLIAEIANDGSEFPAIAFSADGDRLATTGGSDVRLFDLRRRSLARTISGPRIASISFDPTGPSLLTASTLGDVSLWSVESGKRIHHLREAGEPVDSVAFSRDGQLVAAGSRDGSVVVWRATGGLVRQLHHSCTKIQKLEFDAPAQRLAVACVEGTVIIDEITSGLPAAIHAGTNVVSMLSFAPDGRRVIASSRGGSARSWDTWQEYRRWRSGVTYDDCGVLRTPDSERRIVAFSCRGRSTQVWDTTRGALVADLPGVSVVRGDYTSAFPVVSADGALVAIARGVTLEIFELPGGKLVRSVRHPAEINTAAFAERGHDLVSGAVDGSLIVSREGEASLELAPMNAGVDAVALLPDKRIIAVDASRRLRGYAPLGAPLAELVLPGRESFLKADGDRLVTVPIETPHDRSAGPPVLIDLRSFRVVASLATHVGRVFSARWIRGHRVLTAAADGTARLWDGDTGVEIQVFRGSRQYLADATLLDDDVVVGGGADGTLRFWDRASGQALWTMPAHRAPIGMIHVENGTIVTRAFDGEMAGWTLRDPAQVIRDCKTKKGRAQLE